MFAFFAALSALIWLGLLGLPWQPWRMRERFAANPWLTSTDLSDITVLIPARDEAQTLARTLGALSAQGRGLRVIVIDDNSSDATADVARASGLDNLTVIAGEPLPDGWTGKLWALEQGLAYVRTPRVLLLDADIQLAPGTVAGLRDKAVGEGRDDALALVSLMAALRMQSGPERLLMPAFIYFFKLLYPFALSNRGSPLVAAAAGGCMLLDVATLSAIGGFASLRGAVIDDCTLAAHVRAAGSRSWVGVTRDAVSLRGYDHFSDIHAMVARTAYTQLRYSPWLLVACTLTMAVMFWMPPVALATGDGLARGLALLALVAMMLSYLPTLRYYRLSPLWALWLPLIGTLYLGMTWSSALRYWRGIRATWRGRAYGRDDSRR